MKHPNHNLENTEIIDSVLDIGISDFIVDTGISNSYLFIDELVCINSVLVNVRLIGGRMVIVDSILRDLVVVAPSLVSHKSELSGEINVREDIFFNSIVDTVNCNIGGVYAHDFPLRVFEVKGSAYRVYLHKDGSIEIGCVRNRIDKWLKAGKRYAKQLGMAVQEADALYDFLHNLKNSEEFLKICEKQS